jgi:hypothetical protein
MVTRLRNDAAEQSSGNGNQVPVPTAEQPIKVTVDREALRTLYMRMLKSRMSLQKQNTGAQGQEAKITSIIDLLPGDAVALSDEDAAVRIALETSTFVHILQLHIGLAAGVALACKLQNDRKVVVALAAPTTLDIGSAHEALNYAVTERLPLIVLVDCRANRDDLEAQAPAYHIPSIAVDGNDAVAMYRVSRQAIHHARSGRGPTLIQCQMCEPASDPIAHMEHYLEKHGWWTAEWKRELSTECQVPGAEFNH